MYKKDRFISWTKIDLVKDTTKYGWPLILIDNANIAKVKMNIESDGKYTIWDFAKSVREIEYF